MELLSELVEVEESIFEMSIGVPRFLDEHSAIDVFRPLEEPGKSCTKLCLSNISLGVEAARVANRVLMGIQNTLTEVELLNCVMRRSESEALEVIAILSSALERCMLRSLTFDLYELREKGIKAFGPLLKSQKTLENLRFIDTHISKEAARFICELLPSIERMKGLCFHHNGAKNDAAEALSVLVKKCIALEDFEFSGSCIGTRGIKALVGALSECGRLKKLDLSNNKFRTAGGVSLSQVIRGHLGLTKVHLNYMNLEDEGTIAIADSLKDTAPSLRVLTIAGNGITPNAAPALAACLAEKSLLTKFVAAQNNLKDDGSIMICKAISKGHEQLRVLDLSTTAISKIGAKAAAEAVADKPDLSRLSIYGNFITKRGLETVKDVLSKGNKGEYVLGVLYQYKYDGHMMYQYKNEGLSDSDYETDSDLKWYGIYE